MTTESEGAAGGDDNNGGSGKKEKSLKEEIESLSHEDLCEVTQSSLKRIIATDSLLSDLPTDVTTEEVLAQVAVVQGQSVTINILRNLDTSFSVVIPQSGTTVRDLKKAIQRAFSLRQQRMKSRTKVSWSYVWRTYHLRHDSHTMRDNDELVSNYGVRNKSNVVFVKRLRKGQ